MATPLFDFGEPDALPSRGLNEDTCAKFKYHVTKDKDGKPVHVANYCDAKGRVVAQKVRWKGKKFKFLGDPKAAGLYGQHLWRDGGKKVVITEGEIDALSVSQVQGNKWPVVSVPNGANGAAKAVANAIEWLEQFDEVVFMFDSDEPGVKAAEECAALLTPGRAKIATLPLKDANEMLVAGRVKELVDAVWAAKGYRPDGLVGLREVKAKVLKPAEYGLDWPWPVLTQLTYGRKRGEVYMLGAGTGVGKTDVMTELIAHTLDKQNLPVGVFFLEQDTAETVKRVAGKIASRTFHIPDSGWTQEELVNTVEKLDTDPAQIFLYDNFGTCDWEVIKSRIRYLVQACGVKDIFLDHLTALATNHKDKPEREALEEIMAEAAMLTKELNFTLYMVSHLSTPEGKPHEEGGRVMIRHFKGSRAIGFWAHSIFGLERNQQAEDEDERLTTTFRVLKDRYSGQATGATFYLRFDPSSGRLSETDFLPEVCGEGY